MQGLNWARHQKARMQDSAGCGKGSGKRLQLPSLSIRPLEEEAEAWAEDLDIEGFDMISWI